MSSRTPSPKRRRPHAVSPVASSPATRHVLRTPEHNPRLRRRQLLRGWQLILALRKLARIAFVFCLQRHYCLKKCFWDTIKAQDHPILQPLRCRLRPFLTVPVLWKKPIELAEYYRSVIEAANLATQAVTLQGLRRRASEAIQKLAMEEAAALEEAGQVEKARAWRQSIDKHLANETNVRNFGAVHPLPGRFAPPRFNVSVQQGSPRCRRLWQDHRR